MTLQGFDVSHFQSALTTEFVKHLRDDDGYSFCGIKAGEGNHQIDSNFLQNRDACRNNGFPRFLYWEMLPASSNPLTTQLAEMMRATGGHLYPREQIAIVLGDFSVPPADALDFAKMVATVGPVKRTGKMHRPQPTFYANRSNFQSVYIGPNFAPYAKWVAAFPGDGSEFKIPNAVAHQDSNHDPATHGDHDVWKPGADETDLLAFFRQ